MRSSDIHTRFHPEEWELPPCYTGRLYHGSWKVLNLKATTEDKVTYPLGEQVAGYAAASVPCGFTADGLPIGLQIVGPARSDRLVLRAARAFESARPFATLDEPKK